MSVFERKLYDFCVIDFETANAAMSSACSIGITMVSDLEIKNTYYSLIKPPFNSYNAENIAIHGITENDTLNSKTFDLIWEEISDYITNSMYIVSHNKSFDMSVLIESCNYYDIKVPLFNTFDSMYYYRSYPSKLSLSERCRELNIELEHHNALSDSIGAARIVIEETKKARMTSILDYIKEYNIKIDPIELGTYTKKFVSKRKHNRFKISEVNAIAPSYIDVQHPFRDKNIVFTGNFYLEKQELALLARKYGAIIKSTINKNTHILVEGEQEDRYKDENGLVSKQRDALKLINEGYEIQLMNEKEFMELINLK